MDAHMLADRPINHLFSDMSQVYPTCAGDWLEFGVASGKLSQPLQEAHWVLSYFARNGQYAMHCAGGTLNLAAKFRHKVCSPACPSGKSCWPLAFTRQALAILT